MLNVQRLLLLRELHARGTVTAVAEALAYTPSAVSQQLALLGREAGTPLLERVGRRLRFTDAGLGLLGHAEAVLARLEEAEAELAGAQERVAGRLRVAALQTVTLALLPAAMAALRGEHPGLRVEVFDTEAEPALPALALGEFDVVVAEEYDDQPRPRHPSVERRDLFRDEILVALPAGHPQARHGGPVALAALRDEPWAGTRQVTDFAAMHVRTCRGLGGFEPDVVHRSNDIQVLTSLVANAHAVALLPALGLGLPHGGVVVRRVAERPLQRTIFFAHRRVDARRPSVQAFLDALPPPPAVPAAAGL